MSDAAITTTIVSSLRNQWAKIKFYYDHSLAGLTATSTASGYDVDNLTNRLELNSWKATSTATQYITFDYGSGNTYTADYLAISGHNLYTAGSEIALQYSSDNFSADINSAFSGEAATDDNEYVKEFTEASARYWRLVIDSNSVAPQMSICYWGELTELDYASVSFDPNAMADKAVVNVSETGYVLGIHNRYVERQFTFKFSDAEIALYTKIKTWFDAIRQQNFFVAWEITQHPADVFLMRSSPKLKAPLTKGGIYRNISISLTGRLQE
jgi:hypothetical protein